VSGKVQCERSEKRSERDRTSLKVNENVEVNETLESAFDFKLQIENFELNLDDFMIFLMLKVLKTFTFLTCLPLTIEENNKISKSSQNIR
jgi:hypothetical protein